MTPLHAVTGHNPSPHQGRPTGQNSVNSGSPASDPVLAALQDARARKDQADQDIRILLAYARELVTHRPYRLADLAAATGMSISGVRTAYTQTDTNHARHILQASSHAQGTAQHPRHGDHD